MMEIVTIWLKIIGIIIAWEIWKYLGWELACWFVERQVKKHENESNNKRYKG